ncbi:hypothetical protein [Cerasicoccus maritimus]|nr:hypothetical protein [Cerasicoccus maritimus]
MSEPQPHPFLDPSFHVAWSSLDPELIEEDSARPSYSTARTLPR